MTFGKQTVPHRTDDVAQSIVIYQEAFSPAFRGGCITQVGKSPDVTGRLMQKPRYF